MRETHIGQLWWKTSTFNTGDSQRMPEAFADHQYVAFPCVVDRHLGTESSCLVPMDYLEEDPKDHKNSNHLVAL